jgi:hypothetical protein
MSALRQRPVLARNNYSEVGTTMSDSTKRPPAEDTFPAPPLMAVPPTSRRAGEPEAKPDTEQSNHAVGAVPSGPGEDPTEALKRRLEETRLPADVKEHILAALPPPEERERLLRELQEKGGLSSEQFFASLGLEVEPQP